jgi:RNA-directed DNA polymerase
MSGYFDNVPHSELLKSVARRVEDGAMLHLIKMWLEAPVEEKLGHEKRLNAYIVNYADDLVICCRGGAELALTTLRTMMAKLKLTVNENKTRVCHLPEEKFDFHGYTFGRCYSPKTGRA